MSADELDDERVIADELQRRTPQADAGWSGRLGAELLREERRRALTARPSHLWLRVACAAVVGVLLLLVALAQA